jgi:hypothetical protein
VIKHHFNDTPNGEIHSGYWAYDDDAQRIVSWLWDSEQRVLKMQCGPHGRKHDLSSLSPEPMTQQKLRERFPKLAIAFAEEINQKRYDV